MAEQIDQGDVLKRLVTARALRVETLEEQVAILECVVAARDARIAELEALVGEVADQGAKHPTP